MTEAQAITAIIKEVQRAREKHPHWPDDLIHQAAIVAEEAGELVMAALRVAYEGGTPDEITKDAIHTAATCVRLLVGE